MNDVEVIPAALDPFEEILGRDRYRQFIERLSSTVECLGGRTVWNVNSTPEGGGVAEMLASLLGYARGAGVDAGWLVIEGDEEFFEVTKRIHNHLHGEAGDEGELGEEERRVYELGMKGNLDEVTARVRTGDVVILHDPQPMGLAPAVKDAGAAVIWRCHIGVDEPNDLTRRAWGFLRGYLEPADAIVFSRRAYAWEGLDQRRVSVIQPSIDAFSAKNQKLSPETVGAILGTAAITRDGSDGEPGFRRRDGSTGRVTRAATMIEDAPLPPDAPWAVQVSRWDRLKDPVGVLRGFARHVADRTDGHLVLAGPAPSGVEDDPEQGEVLAECREAWEALSPTVRSRAHLACLPMEDAEENAAIVNALQRRADVVVQKSLAEGFGLTVAEAMWKERPVVASRVGGIQDQVEHGRTGLLIDHPEDLEEFGVAVASLLGDADRRSRMGREAHAQVRDAFLAPRALLQYAELIEGLLTCS